MFRLGKRSREDDAAQDVRVPVAALLRAVVSWRDACGQPYKVAHKLDISTDRAVLRLQRFDRVTRAQARALEVRRTKAAAVAAAAHPTVWEYRSRSSPSL